MVERNASTVGLITKRSLICLFTFSSLFLIFSWFSVLGSTGRNHFVTSNSLPDSKYVAEIDDDNSKVSNLNKAESSPGNRVILGNNGVDEEEATAKTKDECRCEMSDKTSLRVYMYDMNPEFHFGLLDWKPQGNHVWPDIRTTIPPYPGGLNLQHSIEYWLTLDLLASEIPIIPNARAAIRVRNSSEADIVFVPFFSSLSYNRFSKVNPHQKKSRNNVLQEKLVRFLTSQTEWKRSGGRDHVILAHHPNSMLSARMKLWPAMFILSDFGRYPPNIANIEKDVIAPYKHMIRSYVNDSSDFDSRPTLLYFQGAIYRKDVSSPFTLHCSADCFPYKFK